MAIDPGFAAAHLNLGVSLEKARDAEACSNLGLAYQHKGQVDAALACYRRALAIRPDYVPARTNLELLLRP